MPPFVMQYKGTCQQFVSVSVSFLWRNRLARSTVNRKVGGSSPPRNVLFYDQGRASIENVVESHDNN